MNELEQKKFQLHLIALRSDLLSATTSNQQLLARHCNPTTDKEAEDMIYYANIKLALSSALKLINEGLEIIEPNWEQALEDFIKKHMGVYKQ